MQLELLILENTLTKVLIAGLFIFFIVHLCKTAKQLPLKYFNIYVIASSVLIIVTEILSLTTVYPYGLIVDLIILYLSYVLIFYISQLSRPLLKTTLFFVILVITTIIPGLFILYSVSFKTAMKTNDFYAVFQTESNEVFEFLIHFIPFYSYLLFALWLYILIKLSIQFASTLSKGNSTLHPKYILYALPFSLLILFLAPADRNIYSTPFFAYTNYTESLETFIKTQSSIKSIPVKSVKIRKKEIASLHIIVIGEATNKNHMSLYGYHRKTTPLLDTMKEKGEIIVFNNAFSNHTHTMPTLKLALTSANQINNRPFNHSLSLNQAFSSLNIRTEWLTNQQLYGAFNHFTAVLAQQSDYIFNAHDSWGADDIDSYDELLLPKINERIQLWDRKFDLVLFIHLLGSHSIYENRYPPKFEKYKMSFMEEIKDQIKKTIYGGGSDYDINHYDNSVYYGDYILSSMINMMKEIPQLNGTLVYFSDHGEDVKRGLGHISNLFTYDMVQIPLIMWLSERYKTSNPNTNAILNTNSNKLFSNEAIYDTVLGLHNIELEAHYTKRLDLSNPAYLLKPEEAKTLHGRKPYASKNNPFYQAP